jgi:peptidoglycan/LPS O-acetylase OafA/YrhL
VVFTGLITRTRRRPTGADHARRAKQESASQQQRGDFRPDIQGLRALAIVTVVLFHAGVPGISGGFVGVDIFFVISGFLITGLLWREAAHSGTVRLAAFYGARARRLLPAGCTVLVVTAIASAVLLPALEVRGALDDAIASALYVGNYRFAVEGADYLAAGTPPSPFQHYWSLGVEEQFYLLWPALIIGCAWLIRRQRPAGSQSVAPFVIVLTFVAVTSYALSLSWTHTSPPWAFFSLPSRAWELAVGGLTAFAATTWRRVPAPAAVITSGVGMTLILLGCTLLGPTTAYPGTAALLPVLGTALIIGSGCATTTEGVNRWLSLSHVQAIGRVSYSWYLWHWPVLILAPSVLGHPLGLGARLAAAALSAGLAALTLVLIEKPSRFAVGLRRSSSLSLALGGALTAVAVVAAISLLALRPLPTGHGSVADAVTVATPAVSASKTEDPYDTAVQQAVSQVQSAVAESVALQAIPSNLSPSLSDAAGDKPEVFLNGCVRSWRDVGQSECASGDTSSPTTVALVGDSHAAMWSPAFEDVAAQRHWRLETLGKVTCPLQDLPITSPYLGREYTECEQWRADILNRLQTERPQLVVLSMSRRYGADFGFTSYDKAWIDSLGEVVARLHSMGARVLVLGPIPDPHSTVPVCLSDHLDDATACGQPRRVAVNDAGIAAEAAATATAGGRYADITPMFCTTDRCPMIVGNNLVYRDDNHVTVEYARALAPVVAALAEGSLNR